jgi:nucleotide-binding universal stress UspA family protein
MKEFHPTRILAAVDLSPLSELVAAAASGFAEAYHASLELVLVQPVEAPLEFMSEQVEALANEHQRNLHALESELKQWARDRVPPGTQLQVLPGAPSELILRQAEHADLIVMGTRGRHGLSRWRLGSVSEGVIRGAQTPVLAIRELARAFTAKFPRILCPVNFSAVSQAALHVAVSLSAHFGTELTVMTSAEAEEQLATQLQETCRSATEKLSPCSVPHLVVRRGQAAEEIVRLAEEAQSDLIVLGAERKASLTATLFGTTTEQLLRHLPASLLVVPGPSEPSRESS